MARKTIPCTPWWNLAPDSVRQRRGTSPRSKHRVANTAQETPRRKHRAGNTAQEIIWKDTQAHRASLIPRRHSQVTVKRLTFPQNVEFDQFTSREVTALEDE